MEILTLSIYNTEGKKIESLKLDQKVFDGTINSDAIYQDVLCHRAGQRKGLASTKTMGEVRGGGRKPWRQKGTGRARVGSIRSPLWRHGGVVFGPHPRDFSYRLPVKIKNLALKSSLNAKVKEGSLVVLDDFNLKNNKTKDAMQVFLNLKLKDKKNKKMAQKNNYVLLLLDKIDEQLRRALRNLSFLNINLAQDTNAYEILACRKLILTVAALNKLVEKIKK